MSHLVSFECDDFLTMEVPAGLYDILWRQGAWLQVPEKRDFAQRWSGCLVEGGRNRLRTRLSRTTGERGARGEAGAEEVPTQTSPTQTVPTGQTSTQVPSQASPTQTAVAKNQFNPKEYDNDELGHLAGCVDPILGSRVTDEIVYEGRPPTAEEIDKIAGCLGEVATGKKQGEAGAEA